MTFEENGVYYIRGIVSMSQVGDKEIVGKIKVCNSKGYVVFIDVAQYVPWIEQMKATNECTKKVHCVSTKHHDDRLVRVGIFVDKIFNFLLSACRLLMFLLASLVTTY